MEEIQRKLTQRYEGAKQRKMRFKLASSYSGRVLKHVYEDGQEVDSPEEKYPHSFMHRKIPPSHLELGQLCGFQETPAEDQQGVYPPTGVIAQRINVYRGVGGYKPAMSQGDGAQGEPNSSVLDFGKIIIYTSNLRIIRAPPHNRPPADRPPPRTRTPDATPLPPAATTTRRGGGGGGGGQEPRPHGSRSSSSSRRRRSKRSPSSTRDGGQRERGRGKERSKEKEEEKEKPLGDAEDKVGASGCQQCKGSGRVACSLCHGSKLSILATRFHESISDLRCQACYPHGLEACQACSTNK